MDPGALLHPVKLLVCVIMCCCDNFNQRYSPAFPPEPSFLCSQRKTLPQTPAFFILFPSFRVCVHVLFLP